MNIISSNVLEILKNFWVFISFLIILAVLIRKPDDKSLNSLQVPFLSGSKKSQKLFDRIVWILILSYLSLAILF